MFETDRRVLERGEGARQMRRKAVRQKRERRLRRAAVVSRDPRRTPGRVAAAGAVASESPAAGAVNRAGVKPCLAPRLRGNAVPAAEWGRTTDLHSSAVSSSLVEHRMIRNPARPSRPDGVSSTARESPDCLERESGRPRQAAKRPDLTRNDPATPGNADRTIRHKSGHSGRNNAGFNNRFLQAAVVGVARQIERDWAEILQRASQPGVGHVTGKGKGSDGRIRHVAGSRKFDPDALSEPCLRLRRRRQGTGGRGR